MKDRFWKKVDVRGPRECWPWTAYRTRKGYGSFNMPPTQRAQQVAWQLTYGPIPAGHSICHSCNNPPCCNPAHLYPATNQENMEYRYRLGRSKVPRGIEQGRAKLTDGIVRWIRALYVPRCPMFGATALGRKFGVHHSAIMYAAYGHTWKHVPGGRRKK